MKIEHEFTVPAPIDRAWEVLTDLETIAPCMPGAQLTGVDGGTYSGKIKVKVGPVISDYKGTATFVQKDDAAHVAVIDGKGRDSRGAGTASAVITARLRPDGEQTVVNVETDLKITGKIAQFGSSMIKEVSEKLLGQFVACLEGILTAPTPSADPAPVAGGTEPVAGSGAEPTVSTESTRVLDPVLATELSAPAAAAAAVPSMDFSRAGSPSEPEALDLMDLAGGTVVKRVIAPVAISAAVLAAIYMLYRLMRR